MPRSKKASANEIVFVIDGFTPKTLPLDRAAQYIEKFAEIIGNQHDVHLLSVDKGSCALRAFAEEPAIPKVRDRIRSVNDGTAPRNALKAQAEVDELLALDNTSGRITLAGENIIEFPGIKKTPTVEFGPIARPSSIDGNIWSIGGKDQTINIQLRDHRQDFKCVVSIALAKKLAPYLFGKKVRLSGVGQWYRIDGTWHMKTLIADDFMELDDSTLENSIDRIRGLLDGVNPTEFLDTMEELRRG